MRRWRCGLGHIGRLIIDWMRRVLGWADAPASLRYLLRYRNEVFVLICRRGRESIGRWQIVLRSRSSGICTKKLTA
jgi:hypothetical protein